VSSRIFQKKCNSFNRNELKIILLWNNRTCFAEKGRYKRTFYTFADNDMDQILQQDNTFFSLPDRGKRQNTMKLAVYEGMLAMITIGLIQTFYVPYLNDLGASKFAIGIGFGTYLLGIGLIQVWAPQMLVWAGNYKRLVIIGTALQAVFLIPFALGGRFLSGHVIWFSIVMMILASVGQGISAGAWADWMSYIVPRKIRGFYFSMRTSLMTLTQFLVSVAAGLMLDNYSNVILVFMFIWLATSAARGAATGLLFWHYEPAEIHARPAAQISFADYIGRLHTHSYGRFVLAYSITYFGAYFASPFFALYMLNDLKFTYFQYSCIQLIMPLATVLSLGMWGRISDRLGNIIPMRLAVLIILLLPACWLIHGSFWFLLGLNIMAGIGWGGFQLLTFNYSIGELPSGQRLAYISYMNAIASLFFFAGSVMGGWLGPMLPQITSFQFHSIFLFSSILRIPAFIMFRKLPPDKPSGTKLNSLEKFFFESNRLFGRILR
jgi:MFS family permease